MFPSLQEFWNNVFATPFHYVEMLFAFLAAIAFLVYLRGFLGAVGNIFKMSEHEGHLDHAYAREVWGVMLLFVLFGLWEVVRTVVSWFGFSDGGQTTLGYWCAAIFAIFIIKNMLSPKKDGGGH